MLPVVLQLNKLVEEYEFHLAGDNLMMTAVGK
jgi:hypothetical protein